MILNIKNEVLGISTEIKIPSRREERYRFRGIEMGLVISLNRRIREN
jgi:hypothetical protein